jgi:hypothetical protein
MNFTVSWSAEAEARLAQAWLSATDRHVISEVANRIDSILQRDAHDIGESRVENRRILHEPPLGVVFSVDVENRRVLVLDLWRYGLH